MGAIIIVSGGVVAKIAVHVFGPMPLGPRAWAVWGIAVSVARVRVSALKALAAAVVALALVCMNSLNSTLVTPNHFPKN